MIEGFFERIKTGRATLGENSPSADFGIRDSETGSETRVVIDEIGEVGEDGFVDAVIQTKDTEGNTKSFVGRLEAKINEARELVIHRLENIDDEDEPGKKKTIVVAAVVGTVAVGTLWAWRAARHHD